MSRISAVIMLAALGPLPALAQRLDGCPAQETGYMIFSLPSSEAIDRNLQDSGIGGTRDALTAALSSSRPDFRSLAALKLGREGGKADLEPLMQASLAETDPCTRIAFASALGSLALALVHDPAQHRESKPWIAPFKPCKPAEPAMAELTVAPGNSNSFGAPTLEISVSNLTAKILPFVVALPEELFSVSVFGPAGAPVKTKGKDYMFDETPGPRFSLAFGTTPSLLILPPGKDGHFWTWNIGDDFDMSQPGTYHVSLGGRIAYLDTTVCSNTAEITVAK
jgi:hypothetical protein